MELKTLVITLIDPNENQFEVLLVKIKSNQFKHWQVEQIEEKNSPFNGRDWIL
jgi:hypothetical protein